MSRLFGLADTATTDDWYTPPWIFEGLGLTFDMDVCAPIGGLPWIPARRSLSESDDGLNEPWEGLVWCNPPYSAPTAWCRKWAQHASGGCLLIRADLSTAGSNVAFAASHCVYFAPKRIQFINRTGGRTSSTTFTTVLLGRGQEVIDAFGRLEDAAGGAARSLAYA